MKIYIIAEFSDPYEPAEPKGIFTDEKKYEKIKAEIIDKFKRNGSSNLDSKFAFYEIETDSEEYNNLEFYVKKGYWGDREV